MPDIPKCDGTTNPQEHVTSYTCAIKGSDVEEDEIESVLLKKFGETLSKGALTWYDHLPEHSITSFKMLADTFIKAHAGAKKVPKERIEIPSVLEEWADPAFTKGLNPRSSTASFKLKENLLEYEAVTWADVHNRYESKIRVEDDQLELAPGPISGSKNFERLRRNYEPEKRPSRDRYRPYSQPEKSSFRSDKGKSGPSHLSNRGDKRADRGSNSRGLLFRGDASSSVNNRDIPRLSEYNFNINTIDLVSAISHIKDARWLRPLRSDLAQRNPSVMYEYHSTHGHRTKDCRQLREEVARLLKNGHLREFLSERAKGHYKGRENHKQVEPVEPQHVINMIIGGTDTPRGPMVKRIKVSIVREKRTRDFVPEGSISFNDEEAEGSSANIIRWRVVEQLRLLDQILPIARVHSGFNKASETTKREISLPVNIDGTIQQTVFYVIEGKMKYNALRGRPWIHRMR
ncbi:uncharacterized protein LOC132045917, partial [Lycium ferocissimum]|uniref:uncharacterized protein LOC132045917 n=1 Tax=Lycium ferocissimum TaxID=112874 RepID=UPI002816018B